MEEQPNINLTLPEHLAGGTLADFVNITHNPNYFTLDFAALTTTPTPQTTQWNAQIIARIKILPPQAIEIMKALNTQLDAWEKETHHQPTT